MTAAENHHPARIRPPLGALAVLAGLLAATVGFYWKLVLTDQYTWLESPDLANQVLPWLQFEAGEWRQRTFPLWDPYLWGGQSLIGQAQPGAAYPLNWILFALPLRNGWIRQSYLHWYFVLIHYLAVCFAYAFARSLGASRKAAAIAGVTFGFGGYVGTTDWPQMLNGAIWAPLVFLFLLRAGEGRRPLASAALSGLFLGMAWLSGHHQIPIYTTLAVLGVWLWLTLRRGRPDWKVAALAAFAFVVTVLFAALQILPAYEYGRRARRWVGVAEPVGWNQKVPYTVHGEYAFYPLSVLGIVIPGLHRHANPFLGMTATALALVGLATGFRERAVRVLAALGLAGLLFSLGHNNVLHGIFYALVPLVEKARTPSMAIFIFNFAFSMLTCFGFDRITAETSSWCRRAALGLLASGILLWTLSLGCLVAGKQPEDRYALSALAAVLAAGLLYTAYRRQLQPGWVWAGAMGLILMELGNVSGFAFAHKLETNRTVYLNKMAQHSDIAEFLRQQPWPVRMAASDVDLPYNFGDWYGIDVFGGYVASLPDNLLRLGLHSERVQNLMGVNYFVGSKPPRPGMREVFRGQSGMAVYLNPDALPRVWSIHELTSVAGDDEAHALLENPGVDLSRTGWIHGPAPDLEACPAEADRVRLLRRHSNFLEVEAEMGCRGMVVLSENFFPGWEATVDGRPARIWQVYTALRGVVVERGRHRIQMRYRPRSVRWGAAGTVLAVLAVGCAVWVDRRRRPMG